MQLCTPVHKRVSLHEYPATSCIFLSTVVFLSSSRGDTLYENMLELLQITTGDFRNH
jgi:hypothetical protein